MNFFLTLARNLTPRSYAQTETVKQWFLKNEYNRGVQKYTKSNLEVYSTCKYLATVVMDV